MVAFMDSGKFANPAAHHHDAGKAAWHEVEEARSVVANAIHAKTAWVSFTGSASEANNIIIHGFARRHPRCRILVGATEHKSVLDPALDLRGQPGCEVEVIPVESKTGCIDLAALESSLASNQENLPTLVAIMWCNNEIPARNPVEEIARLCTHHRAFFHCDSVQGIVREAVDVTTLARAGLSSMIFAPHKIYGPKGIGVLVIPEREPMLRIDAPFQGGEQEKRLRPGTLNTLAIVGTGVAVDLHARRRNELVEHLRQCDEAFIYAMRTSTRGFHLTVSETTSCPGIVNFYIDGVDAESLVHTLASDVCVNRGASCSGAGGEKARHVPTALGLPVEIAANVIRVSFGFGNSLEDARVAASHIAAIARNGHPH
ncbi:MAG: hypothetical protein RIQ81_1977 [Pseudomonadota bacterium]